MFIKLLSMKKILFSAALLLMVLASCKKEDINNETQRPGKVVSGYLNVTLAYENGMETKATTDYTTVLDTEKAEKKVAVYVFDKESGQLNVSKTLTKTSDAFNVTVPVGTKTVYAIVNGPDLSNVTTISQMQTVTDNLAVTSIEGDGFTMIGSADCTISASTPATAAITVRRLVSRIVLKKVTNSLPSQYGNMTIEAIYLGDANSVQTFAGAVSAVVNPSGYADASKTKAIGKNNVTGSCSGYMFKKLAANVNVGSSYATAQHLYCQPNSSSTYTTLHMLMTIGGLQYYYKIPITGGIKANHTYSVEANVINLGTDNPDEVLVKGELNATITVAGWSAGEEYDAEF